MIFKCKCGSDQKDFIYITKVSDLGDGWECEKCPENLSKKQAQPQPELEKQEEKAPEAPAPVQEEAPAQEQPAPEKKPAKKPRKPKAQEE